MQDAAGNIFVDRSGIWIRRHSHHSVINILVGILLVFQVVFRPAAYCGCLTICLYQTISTLTCVRSISIAKLSINSIRFRRHHRSFPHRRMGLLVLPFLSLKYNLSGLVDSTNSIITIIVAKLWTLHTVSS